jgi:hypothetical protein
MNRDEAERHVGKRLIDALKEAELIDGVGTLRTVRLNSQTMEIISRIYFGAMEQLAEAVEQRSFVLVSDVAKKMAAVLADNAGSDIEFGIDIEPPPLPWEAIQQEQEP